MCHKKSNSFQRANLLVRTVVVVLGTGNYQNSGAMGMSSDVNYSPLPPSIARNLNDRLYEKRKQAALEIEK